MENGVSQSNLSYGESQKQYDNTAKKQAIEMQASRSFELFGKVLGFGSSFKEDIVRIDAEMEKEAREKFEKNPEAVEKEYLDKLKNSSLVVEAISEGGVSIDDLTDRPEYIKKDPRYQPVEYALDGVINGKKVSLHVDVSENTYKGSIDGQELPQNQAKKIFDDYLEVAKERTGKIIQAMRQRNTEPHQNNT